jgi:hypothetical protein
MKARVDMEYTLHVSGSPTDVTSTRREVLATGDLQCAPRQEDTI